MQGAVPDIPAHYEGEDESIILSAPEGLSLELESVLEGVRNVSLFDVVRFWAYQQDRGQSLDAWVAKVLTYALQSNSRFPSHLPLEEVQRLAYSVATWCWQGGEKIDHSPTAQRRRGIKSGKVRRARNAERDAGIIAAVKSGESMRSIERRLKLSHGTVRHVCQRGGE